MRYLALTSFLALIFCRVTALAQQPHNGYVITNQGDTLRGSISTSAIGGYEEIKFEQDGVKKEYNPYQLKGYKVNKEVFVSKARGKHEPPVFMKVLVVGYCSLYIYGETGMPGANGMTTVKRWWYLQKEGEEIHEGRFQRIKYGKDPYLNDNPGLINDIRKGKYGERHFAEIIKRYNAERFR